MTGCEDMVEVSLRARRLRVCLVNRDTLPSEFRNLAVSDDPFILQCHDACQIRYVLPHHRAHNNDEGSHVRRDSPCLTPVLDARSTAT
jgi:hypothetical protein